MIQYSGLALLLAWTVNIWCFMSVVEARPGALRTAVWATILLIPLAGFVIWYLFGPRPARR